jgi:hypothetical protein
MGRRATRPSVLAAALLLVALIRLPAAELRNATVASDTGKGEPPAGQQRIEANLVMEMVFTASRPHPRPFKDVELDVAFTDPSGARQVVPAFWAGGPQWKVRYSSPITGLHQYRTQCSDASDAGLHGVEGRIEITPYTGSNPLHRHGLLRVASDRRHFEHADGTPFFWLGDTWWKNLCKRMTWEGFQELAADRRGKGFTVVQIVCGPYPDEGLFEPRWENEGGKPYETRDFTVVNPAYFEYADRRLQHLVNAGLVPAIVGGWGRGDCDAMKLARVEGMKRHWRHLVARYGAYPTVWIIGGESGGPEWTEVARYVQKIDPNRHPATIHPFDSGRLAVTDETVLSFDMLQTGHGDWQAATGAIPKLRTAYARQPAMPVLIGEYCYEGHMQTAFQDVQRYVFWSSLLSGSAGLTYGAAGVWHASVEGDPGLANVYDRTTWREGMNYPGSTQLGLGKRLLERYPWWRFEPHPEWTEQGSFAAGLPARVRFIYMPKRGVYNWTGPSVRGLEREVMYQAFYFDPAAGRPFDLGRVVNPGPAAKPFEDHAQPLRFADRFETGTASAWKDYGSPSTRQGGRLAGGKGMLTVLETVSDTDLLASIEANSDAEAGIVLRFHDPSHYLVALYSPSLKAIFLHDRKNGAWGAPLGKVPVPKVGPRLRLAAAASGESAALVLTDGELTWQTPIVKVGNTTAGKTGVWLFQIGERQEFRDFKLSTARFTPPQANLAWEGAALAWSGEYDAPNVPSPQDWVLVLERATP